MSEFVYLYRSTPEQQRDAMGTPAQAQRSLERYLGWIDTLRAGGHLKHPGQPLASTGSVVRKDRLVTDGPYIEAKDLVLGFLVVEARDLAHAIALTDGCPILDGGSIEVRPVTTLPHGAALMRAITVFENISADGFFADLDGNLDWVQQDPAQHAAAAARTALHDGVIFGRKTYEQFASFWPHALDNAGPHGASASPAMGAFARFLNAANKLVFSTTLAPRDLTWANTTIASSIDSAALTALKQQPGKDILIFGSGTIVAQLTELGLIDEYQLVVNPILLGAGRPWLPPPTRRAPLALVESTPYPSGNVLLRYRRR